MHSRMFEVAMKELEEAEEEAKQLTGTGVCASTESSADASDPNRFVSLAERYLTTVKAISNFGNIPTLPEATTLRQQHVLVLGGSGCRIYRTNSISSPQHGLQNTAGWTNISFRAGSGWQPSY